jgi:NADH-quinone oxidoreductase subunit M
MHFLNQWVLTILLLIPLGGAVAVAVLRRRSAVVRRVALGTTVAACAVSLLIFVPFRWRQMLSYDEGARGSVKLSQRMPIAGGAEYHVAADGISIPFIILTTLLFASLCAAAFNVQSNPITYLITLVILEFATLGIFVCFDLLLFVVLMGLTAVAMIVLARLDAQGSLAMRGTMIHLLISVACLVLVAIYSISGPGTFDLVRGAQSGAKVRVFPNWVLVLTVFSFLIRMAALPVHSWLVTLVSQVKSPTSIVATSILPATGAYGLIRVALPISSGSAGGTWTAFVVLGVVGFIAAALCAMAARNLRGFVAYSTVSTMGLILLAIGLRIPTAIDGAMMLLLGHSLVSAMMLILADLAPPSPASDRVPIWNAFFGLAWIAWLVGPVLGGQIVITLACFESARASSTFGSGIGSYGLAIAAVFGVLLSAVAAARIARRTFLPPVQTPTEIQTLSLSPIDVTILAILSGVSLLLGLLPGFLCYTFTHPAARALLHAE